MVQFLSINFFLGFLQFLLGFSKFPVFFVSLCIISWHVTPFGVVRRINVSKERAPISGLKVRYSLFHRNVDNIVPDYTAPDPEALCLNIHRPQYLGTDGLRKKQKTNLECT